MPFRLLSLLKGVLANQFLARNTEAVSETPTYVIAQKIFLESG